APCPAVPAKIRDWRLRHVAGPGQRREKQRTGYARRHDWLTCFGRRVQLPAISTTLRRRTKYTGAAFSFGGGLDCHPERSKGSLTIAGRGQRFLAALGMTVRQATL